MFGTLEVLGPEHEFSVVDQKLHPLPIVDAIIKQVHGRIVNNVNMSKFSFGKELQAHVLELKAIKPFHSPQVFEETIQEAVETILDALEKHHAKLLGLGMHPSLNLNEAQIWTHRDRQIYEALGRIFNLRQHGWLNIQSFQLNLPYRNEKDAIKLHNTLNNILPYLPALAASSPIFETKKGDYMDNRLHFYSMNQREVPSITGDVIPEHVNSLEEYEKATVNRYSDDLCKLGASRCLLNKKWLNSRGAVIRPDRKAIEIRILDEQECVKSDVALSCFIRAVLRGMMNDETYPAISHKILVQNLNHIIKDGLDARVQHPAGNTAKRVCQHLLKIAYENANEEEKEYLPLIKQRMDSGNLSQMILRDISKRTQKTDISEAIFDIYSSLADCLTNNRVYA